jgi:hypothetical protein
VTGWWFSPGTPAFSTNEIDRHDIAKILLKVVLNTINQTNQSTTYSHKYTIEEVTYPQIHNRGSDVATNTQ